MKAIRITILAAIIVLSGLAGSVSGELVAQWTFDTGTAVCDAGSAGAAADGTLENGASIIADPGGNGKDPNNVLQVDNSLQQYVNCGGGNGGWGDLPGPITVMAWYKPLGWMTQRAAVVSKGGGENDGFTLSRHYMYDNIGFTCMSTPTWMGLGSTDPNAWDGNWHHAAGVYTPGQDGPEWYPAEVEIYIDGVLSATAVKWGKGDIIANEWDVAIGGNHKEVMAGSGYHFWYGLIDDARIYDEALDANTIMDIYMGSTPEITLTLNIEPNDVGIDTVTPGAGEHLYYPDQPAHLRADNYLKCPDVYKFNHWEGDVADANSANTTVIMDEDKTVKAVFVDTRECGDECHPILAGDLNGDCYINFDDFAIYCAQWLSCTHPNCD